MDEQAFKTHRETIKSYVIWEDGEVLGRVVEDLSEITDKIFKATASGLLACCSSARMEHLELKTWPRLIS
jgi:hypothetical protein